MVNHAVRCGGTQELPGTAVASSANIVEQVTAATAAKLVEDPITTQNLGFTKARDTSPRPQ